MKLYQRIIFYSALTAAAISLFGCDSSKQAESDSRVRQANTTNNLVRYNYKNYFTSFGELSGLNTWNTDSPLALETADLDGDGDLDVILADRSQGLVWAMENRIPQKSKKD